MEATRMHRFTVIAPTVRNDGAVSGYPQALRMALLDASIDGWTEYMISGSWRGVREPGVTFEILREDTTLFHPHKFARLLCDIARCAMGPEQEAIQVTLDMARVAVYEA